MALGSKAVTLVAIMRFAITLTVDATAAGKPLAAWLIYMLLDETPASVQAALEDGRVEVDGVTVRDPDTPLRAGAEVKFQQAGD